MSTSEFYTYAWLREDKSPFYIGKGRGRRAWDKHSGRKAPPDDRILILKSGLTEAEAFKHEIYMIAVLGRKDRGTGILRNLTDGGQGPSGWAGLCGEDNPFYGKTHDEATRQVMREAKLGSNNPNFGKPRDEETRRKIGLGNSGPSPAKSRSKLGSKNPNFGKRWWTNGHEQRLQAENPGEDWTLGRLRKRTSK